MLLHLLHAVVVRVDEVKGQRASQWATASAWGNAEKPASRTQTDRKKKAKRQQKLRMSTREREQKKERLAAWVALGSLQLPCIINLNNNNLIFTENEGVEGGSVGVQVRA